MSKGTKSRKSFRSVNLLQHLQRRQMQKTVSYNFTSNCFSWSMVSQYVLIELLAWWVQVWFRALIKNAAPHITFTYCVLHRHGLVSKTLPLKLTEAYKFVVKRVNYVQGHTLNYCIFVQLCEQMDSQSKSFCATLKFVGYLGERWLIMFFNSVENYSHFWKFKIIGI